MMDAMPLRVVDPCHKPTERDAHVQVSTSVGNEEDKARGDCHIWWDPKQDRQNWKKGVSQHSLEPIMSGAGNERNCVCAVMERMHRPKERDGMLETMECVFVEIERHHDKCKRYVPPVTFDRQVNPPKPGIAHNRTCDDCCERTEQA